jgi:hypothetical protein
MAERSGGWGIADEAAEAEAVEAKRLCPIFSDKIARVDRNELGKPYAKTL